MQHVDSTVDERHVPLYAETRKVDKTGAKLPASRSSLNVAEKSGNTARQRIQHRRGKQEKRSSWRSGSPKRFKSSKTGSSRQRSPSRTDRTSLRSHGAPSSSSAELSCWPKRSACRSDAKAQNSSLEVVLPVRIQNQKDLDNRSYRLVDTSSEYGGSVSKNIAMCATE